MAQFRKDTHQYLNDGKTIFEVMMLADEYGNLVGPANPSGMAVDAFGRARSSNPFTLYDSVHLYKDNGKEASANSSGGTYSFNSNTASMDLNLTTASGAYVYRESKKVFAYQPGKSLQIMKSFVMNAAKANLRQRVGYFDENNGFYLERSELTANGVCFVKRSKVTGVVVNTPVDQQEWNVDKLDGTGPSLKTLNLDNPQILFFDIEWLGVGSVRAGFIIDGDFIHCHTFHHANLSGSAKGAYMQTAMLPIRSEIENTNTTSSSSSYKQICATVISEGGYHVTGRSHVIGQDPTAAKHIALSTAGTYYPVVSIRLNADYKNAMAILKHVDLIPINSANYRYKLINGATLNGGVWANVNNDSVVQYNTNTSATFTGGDILTSGYVTSTVQAGGSIDIQTDNIFLYQLERDSFANTTMTLTLAVTSGTATCNVVGSMVWEEVG